MKKRFLMVLAFVASLFTLTTAAYAEGTGTGVDAGTIKTAIDQVGIPTLIGAVALAMFSIYALIMGIRAVIAFLKRG